MFEFVLISDMSLNFALDMMYYFDTACQVLSAILQSHIVAEEQMY